MKAQAYQMTIFFMFFIIQKIIFLYLKNIRLILEIIKPLILPLKTQIQNEIVLKRQPKFKHPIESISTLG